MISRELHDLLFNRSEPFVTVATCDLNGKPNAAPKLLLKYEKGCLFLVDVPYGNTWENIKSNPNLSLSFFDLESLRCYRMKGKVTLIEQGHVHEKMRREIDEKLHILMVNRIIEGVRREKAHKNFLVRVGKEFVVFKVKIQEVVEYGLHDIRDRKIKKSPLAEEAESENPST